jgi:stage II sporulation protein M
MEKKNKSIKRKKKGNKNFINLKEEYSLSLNYIKDSKNFIFSIVAVALVFGVIGFFVQVPEDVLQKIIEMLQDILKQIEGLNQFELIKFIFLNNLKSSFFGLFFGAVLGIFPVMSAIVNGYLIGFVAQQAVSAEGIFTLLRLLPHGIFELPAVFISLGMGLRLGTFIFHKNKIKTLKSFFWNSFRVFIFVVIPLLVVAAIIEGTLISLF